MDNVYLVTRPNGTKKCYDWIRTLEREEGFKKKFFEENQLPFKEGGFSVEKIEHDPRVGPFS